MTMTHVVVGTEIETWRVQAGDNSDEPYSYRGETGGQVSNVTAIITDHVAPYYGDSHGKDIPDARPGDTVYAVVVEYTTGDSFGRDGGQAVVLDFFTDPVEAAALAERAAQHNSRTDGFGFEHNGEHYSTQWCGYFESLDSINVWDIQIKGKTPDFSESRNWRFKRGY